jgi:23S rRNA (uracil1939-C5)-methyltransferase
LDTLPGASGENVALGATLELEIERLAPGGEGVGRDPAGRVVFVAWTAPGDRVRVRIDEARPRFARGSVEALLRAGPGRAEPRCEVFGSCGGCAWQHVAYPVQLEAKRTFIRDAIERIAHLPVPEPLELVPCPLPYGYRIRTRVRVEDGRVGYRQRRSHALCPTQRCPVLTPALERALAELPARARHGAGDWWLAQGSDGQAHAAPADEPGAARGRRTRPPRVRLDVAGQSLECGLGGFTQANGPLFEPVASAVVEAAGRGATAIELFAGAGYLTLGLARAFGRVLAVEGDPRAARDLARNCERAGARGVEVVTAPVERALREAPLAASAPEVAVLDPPRAGLPEGAAGALCALGAARLVYLSCDPSTLARDAARLAAGGYALAALRGFDLFPQTPHVETLAVFARSQGMLARSS